MNTAPPIPTLIDQILADKNLVYYLYDRRNWGASSYPLAWPPEYELAVAYLGGTQTLNELTSGENSTAQVTLIHKIGGILGLEKNYNPQSRCEFATRQRIALDFCGYIAANESTLKHKLDAPTLEQYRSACAAR